MVFISYRIKLNAPFSFLIFYTQHVSKRTTNLLSSNYMNKSVMNPNIVKRSQTLFYLRNSILTETLKNIRQR